MKYNCIFIRKNSRELKEYPLFIKYRYSIYTIHKYRYIYYMYMYKQKTRFFSINDSESWLALIY